MSSTHGAKGSTKTEAATPANILESGLLERIKKALREDLSQEDLAAFGVGHNRGPPLDDILGGYATDEQLAKARGISLRTQRLERQRGEGPPFVRDGRKILYPTGDYRAWLAAKMVQPVRGAK